MGLFRRRPPEPPAAAAPPDPRVVVRAYHRRTKHHLQRYALGPHELDWENHRMWIADSYNNRIRVVNFYLRQKFFGRHDGESAQPGPHPLCLSGSGWRAP